MKSIAVAILAGAFSILSVPAQVPGGGGTNSTTERNLPRGLEQRQELPPGLQNRDELPPGLARRTNDVTSPHPGTNTPPRAGSTVTNQGGPGSRTNLPSGQPVSTNATSSMPRQDSALTQGDQRILALIRNAMKSRTTSTTTAAGPSAPVHFIVQNGVVQIVGSAPTAEERQRIQTTVERIPGVTGVVNRIDVADQTSTDSSDSQIGANTNAPGASGTNALFPTSRTNQQSSQYSNTNRNAGTNLPPTSRTNAPDRNLPPGLENRDELPPGLRDRDQLPPGLERRTNSPGGI